MKTITGSESSQRYSQALQGWADSINYASTLRATTQARIAMLEEALAQHSARIAWLVNALDAQDVEDTRHALAELRAVHAWGWGSDDGSDTPAYVPGRPALSLGTHRHGRVG